MAHIGQNGPVRSADFEHPRKGASGWWEWKPHKRHLEGLFTAGEGDGGGAAQFSARV
jgi:uncharacterized protein YcaQ